MNSDAIIYKIMGELKDIDSYGVKRSLVQLEKELNIYFDCQKNKPTKSEIKRQLLEKNKLQIGGGKHYLNGFINIDLGQPADIIYDVRKEIPLPEKSVNFIFTEHFLEHIDYPDSVLRFFSEVHRVLRRGGKLVIGVPDAGLTAKAYAMGDRKFLNKIKKEWYTKRSIINHIESGIDIVDLVIRDQDADAVYNPHFWGYDDTKLKKLFKDSGFKTIKKWNFDKTIANPKRQFGSIYIEGVKI